MINTVVVYECIHKSVLDLVNIRTFFLIWGNGYFPSKTILNHLFVPITTIYYGGCLKDTDIKKDLHGIDNSVAEAKKNIRKISKPDMENTDGGVEGKVIWYSIISKDSF